MAMPVDKWSDDRLDEMNRRVINLETLQSIVTEMRVEQREMKITLEKVGDGVGKLSDKLGQVVDEPLVRQRDSRAAIRQAAFAALVGGVIVFVATLLGNGLHP
jgi:hypothetical protein